MNQPIAPHSAAWITFSYVSAIAAAGMLGIGILFLPLDWWARGYLAMGAAMLAQTTVNLTKTLRDAHESSKLLNRIEDARTERLLMGVTKAD